LQKICIASSSNDQTVIIWKYQGDTITYQNKLVGFQSAVVRMLDIGDEKHLVTGEAKGT